MKPRTIEPLQLVLAAKEKRAIQKKKLTLEGFPCVSLSLNIPGFPKSNSIAKRFFLHCLNDLRIFLKAHLIEIIEGRALETDDEAGDHFISPIFFGLRSILEIKQICENFEENHPLGRFIDVDINDDLGNTISSGKSKLCFFCQAKPAIECRRFNAHDPVQLRLFMFSKMAEFCTTARENAISKRIASLGLRAILTEISLSPKPGLVDKFSNGSHTDMDFQTFIDSSAVISGWFEELVHTGFSFRDKDLTKALPVIRTIGLRMESSMYQSTNNINSQKGIIFLMGLSLFSMGMLYRENAHFEIELFRGFVKGICKDIVKNELVENRRKEVSHGEDSFQKFSASGARGEAESGFRIIFEYGFPQLSGFSKLDDESMIKCLLAIASKNQDTNILFRRGPETLTAFQNVSKRALENFNDTNYSSVLEFCKRENISPGGSADLLAVSILIWSVIEAEQNDDFITLLLNNDI